MILLARSEGRAVGRFSAPSIGARGGGGGVAVGVAGLVAPGVLGEGRDSSDVPLGFPDDWDGVTGCLASNPEAVSRSEKV